MSTLFEIIFWVLTGFYLYETLRIYSGLRKKITESGKGSSKTQLDGISLIIPVRNEKANLNRLISNLDEIKRPECGFEVIFADDHSDDGSSELLNQFAIEYEWVRVVRLKDVAGKPLALDTAIQSAGFSIIATTDADMILNTEWLQFLETQFSYGKNLSMLCGPTVSDSDGFLGSVQQTDWMYMMAMASGSLRSGHPFTAIGNNMAFLKTDYLELGGFRNLPFSITEDFALFRLFLTAGKRVTFPSSSQNIHITQSNQSWQELVSQRKRWILGGVKSPVRSWLLVISAAGLHLSLLFGWIINPWLTVFSSGTKVTGDFLLIREFTRQTGMRFSRKSFFVFELVYPIINLTIPLLALFSRKIKWKGRAYFESGSR